MQENTISVQFVPGMRFLVFDFGVYVMCGTVAMLLCGAEMGHAICSRSVPRRLSILSFCTETGYADALILY
eukprot:1168676-Rhodomonas_salina.1